MKKKICWATPDYFLDVDLPIIPSLLDKFDIHWIILFDVKNRFQEKDFDRYRKYEGLTIEIFRFTHRMRDVRRFIESMKLKKMIMSVYADLYYINFAPNFIYNLPLFYALPKKRTIVTAHDGSIKSIMKLAFLVKCCFKSGYGAIKFIQMFSNSEAKQFELNFPGHDIFVIPLALKDYGTSTIEKRTDCISFLSFGTMHQEKNIGLLIDAADQLYDEGLRGFKVSINGVWREKYDISSRIKHPEIFEISLGMVPNESIPNLYGKNHYAVLPYKIMSQSGAIKVAFNYCTPVIVSDLEAFKEEVRDSIDGYIFKSGNIEDLKSIMRKCIIEGNVGYSVLQSKMSEDIHKRFSIEKLVSEYVSMFNIICE